MKQDKKLHLFVGFLISFIAGAVTTFFDMENPNLILGCIVGFSSSMIITLAKEFIWDKLLGKGVFSWKDILFGTYGAVAGVIITIIIFLLSNT